MTRRILTAALIAFTLSGTAASHPQDDGTHTHKTITVEPITSSDAAKQIMDEELAHLKLDLEIGQKAPKLEIAEWVKGSAVNTFKEGHVYVVEFWATWCGPCIYAFPHVSELQEKYEGKATVIGVNIWDRNRDRETGEYSETMDDLIERIEAFVKEQGDKMGYSVAIEETGKMADNWMRAAARNGIPSAFIVDGKGRVAWAGHPMSMDEPLKAIVEGNWDYTESREAQLEEAQGSFWRNHTLKLLEDEETVERGYKLAYSFLRSPASEDYVLLCTIAWRIMTSESIAARDYEAALSLAAVATETTNWEDAQVVNLLAMAYSEKGDLEKAVEVQGKAVELAEGTPMEADMRQALETYKAALN